MKHSTGAVNKCILLLVWETGMNGSETGKRELANKLHIPEHPH